MDRDTGLTLDQPRLLLKENMMHSECILSLSSCILI